MLLAICPSVLVLLFSFSSLCRFFWRERSSSSETTRGNETLQVLGEHSSTISRALQNFVIGDKEEAKNNVIEIPHDRTSTTFVFKWDGFLRDVEPPFVFSVSSILLNSLAFPFLFRHSPFDHPKTSRVILASCRTHGCAT